MFKSNRKLRKENEHYLLILRSVYQTLSTGPCEVMNCLGCETEWVEAMRLLEGVLDVPKSE